MLKIKELLKRGVATLALLGSLAATLLLLGGCEAAETATDGEEVTLTDALGYTVSIKRRPRRVAALLGSFADVWELAGGELCASADDAWEDFGMELPNAVNIGGAHSPSVELLLSADPDLVLASAGTASHVGVREYRGQRSGLARRS